MKTRTHITIVGLIVLMILSCSTALSAYSRDPDGSRMQARKHALGTTSSDRLHPPTDSVDWRYVKLKAPQVLKVSVTNAPGATKMRIQLTDAVGKSLASRTSTSGKGSLSHRVAPGLYYVSVSSNAPTKYKITIR